MMSQASQEVAVKQVISISLGSSEKDYQFETEVVSRLVLAGRAFLGSMSNPDFAFETVDEIKNMLAQAGFQSFSEARPISDGLFFECWK